MFAVLRISEAETIEAVNSILPYLDAANYSTEPLIYDSEYQSKPIQSQNKPVKLTESDNETQKFRRDGMDPSKCQCLAKVNGIVCGKIIKGFSSSNILKHYRKHFSTSSKTLKNINDKDKMSIKREKSRVRSKLYYHMKQYKRVCQEIEQSFVQTPSTSPH